MKNKKLKTALLLGGVSASLLMMPVVGFAANDAAGWFGVIAPAAGLVISLLLTGIPNVMTAVNVDPAQLALEYMVYQAQQDITYVWEPEPEESYEKAAESNENSGSPGTGSVSGSTEEGNLNFEVQVLTATGLESVGLEGTTEALTTTQANQIAMDGLTFLEQNSEGGIYFNSDLTLGERSEISQNQENNAQWLSTAALARSELGLMSAQQAATDDGGSDISGTDSGESENAMAEATGAKTGGSSVGSLAGTGTSTGMAMRIQALMNLEFAQRLNLTDTLQGGSLSVQAAQVLKTTTPQEN